MQSTMRRSMIVTPGSFVFFGVAYLCLMRITDPREPLDAAANAHLSIRLAFATINWSAQIAFLLVVLMAASISSLLQLTAKLSTSWLFP
jgi:hypothetical protein